MSLCSLTRGTRGLWEGAGLADTLATLRRGRQKSPRVLGMVEITYSCLNIFLFYATGQELNSEYCFTVLYLLHSLGKRQDSKNCHGLQEKKKEKGTKNSPPSFLFPSLVKISK